MAPSPAKWERVGVRASYFPVVPVVPEVAGFFAAGLAAGFFAGAAFFGAAGFLPFLGAASADSPASLFFLLIAPVRTPRYRTASTRLNRRKFARSVRCP